jgi:hypothetical protein
MLFVDPRRGSTDYGLESPMRRSVNLLSGRLLSATPRTRMESDEGLDAWIAALRDRRERGDLVGLEPFDLGYGTYNMPAELTIAIMLADLDGCSDPSIGQRARARDVLRRQGLLNDFRRLRELIG